MLPHAGFHSILNFDIKHCLSLNQSNSTAQRANKKNKHGEQSADGTLVLLVNKYKALYHILNWK